MRLLQNPLEEVVQHALSFLDKGVIQIPNGFLGRYRWDVAPWPTLQHDLSKEVEIAVASVDFEDLVW